jgi:hypothetical protein
VSSDLLQKMLSKAGASNAENIEKAREELAGAITRVIVNEALRDAKSRAQKRDEIMAKPEGGNAE